MTAGLGQEENAGRRCAIMPPSSDGCNKGSGIGGMRVARWRAPRVQYGRCTEHIRVR